MICLDKRGGGVRLILLFLSNGERDDDDSE